MGFDIGVETVGTGYVSLWGLLLLSAVAFISIAGKLNAGNGKEKGKGKGKGKHLKKAAQPLRGGSSAEQTDAEIVDEGVEDAYAEIEALHGFDVDGEEPVKARPFKPRFHMTMAIENTTLSELIAMDKTYHSRIQLRRSLVAAHHAQVIGSNAKAAPAVFELYTWLTRTYLPTRFPTLFTLTLSGLFNRTTSETLPLTAASATHALELLASHIDDDFLFLLPSDDEQDGGKYRLEAFATCFPSGFRTRSKLGLLLADIHAPVPHYAAKLERSMDRFFAGLRVGRIVQRWNWAVSTTGELFCVAGNHATSEELEGKRREHVDLRNTYLRCERQTLHRLPQSRALVFAFKTYQYPIQELRDDGSGEALCEAIDGMATGSAPQMAVYKRQVVWGDKVKAFLRGEIGVDQ